MAHQLIGTRRLFKSQDSMIDIVAIVTKLKLNEKMMAFLDDLTNY